MSELLDELRKLHTSDDYPFHMPGHKRRNVTGVNLPYEYDITEINGFDDLHHANGILRRIEEKASMVYQCADTALLVNGSTGGILSAILGCTKRGDSVLVARNCHRSVYHAMMLHELQPTFLYPDETDRIQASDIHKQLSENPQIKAIIITSPTYEGVLSHIKEIVDVIQNFSKDIYLIVDEAHGAHLGFHSDAPKSALYHGADLVIHSLHKTLPAFTQTGLIHANKKAIKTGIWKQIRFYLSVFQSSSPSYVLMLGIDECLNYLLRERQTEDCIWQNYYRNINKIRDRLEGLQVLSHKIPLQQFEHDYDFGKIVISTEKACINGHLLFQLLREQYQLQLELYGEHHVLAMTSIADSECGLERLANALLEIDTNLMAADTFPNRVYDTLENRYCMEEIYTNEEEENNKIDISSLNQKAGKISTCFIYVYPPGIPLVAPGDLITYEMIQKITTCIENGLHVRGLDCC